MTATGSSFVSLLKVRHLWAAAPTAHSANTFLDLRGALEMFLIQSAKCDLLTVLGAVLVKLPERAALASGLYQVAVIRTGNDLVWVWGLNNSCRFDTAVSNLAKEEFF